MSSQPVDSFGIDTEIDIAIDEQDEGERRAQELASRIRTVAATDPELAQDLVDQLIVALDRAMGGTFREHLDEAARGAADRAPDGPGRHALPDGDRGVSGEASGAPIGRPRGEADAPMRSETDSDAAGDTDSKMDRETSTVRDSGEGGGPAISPPKSG
ncbi:hypothetical protein [Krasilnikovia sp. MM14-A1259]|uniref:hypothetical protein n=1 Tax=Krasilnikovia sp. MM14-A1259 TaxID=3373539 RepID=UPI00399CDAC8